MKARGNVETKPIPDNRIGSGGELGVPRGSSSCVGRGGASRLHRRGRAILRRMALLRLFLFC